MLMIRNLQPANKITMMITEIKFSGGHHGILLISLRENVNQIFSSQPVDLNYSIMFLSLKLLSWGSMLPL
jgi:hypothetical protein